MTILNPGMFDHPREFRKIIQLTGQFVDFDDLVHEPHGQNDLVEHGHAASHQSRVAALRTNGEFLLIAVAQYGRDFFRALWLQHNPAGT